MRLGVVAAAAACFCLLSISGFSAADTNGTVAPAHWTADWIADPAHPPTAFGVYLFRRSLLLTSRPESFRVFVSADNRYQLIVNGQRMAAGPATSSPAHWQYDTVDLAPFMRVGRNVIGAVVWNFGPYSGWAQMSQRTAFLLQGAGPAEQMLDTGPQWRVAADAAYRPHSPEGSPTNQGEDFDSRLHPWAWDRSDFDDRAWTRAVAVSSATTEADPDRIEPWTLTPRRIPPMAEVSERLSRVRRSIGITVPNGFPAHSGVRLTIPAYTAAVLLLDQDRMTTAFPEVQVTGGRDSVLRLRYAEALNVPGQRDNKGQRDEIDNKELGNHREDVFTLDGGARTLRTLDWRAYRYVELAITTSGEPLTIEDMRGVFTAYPFVSKAHFDAKIDGLDTILDTGWRTARLCAHDTYMDCPYWERLQYVGDTRIQGLISLFTSGDGRLLRQAILQIDESRTADGLTASRYPSHKPQIIPPFSLWWIGMIHDYWRYQDDASFVRARLPGVRAVLAAFSARQQADGRLGVLPYWNFVDWVGGWPGGVPPGFNAVPHWVKPASPGFARDGSDDPRATSAILDLQLSLAYQWATDLESALGSKALANENRRRAKALNGSVMRNYWDSVRGLVADTAAKSTYSQHANVLAVLAHVFTGERARKVMERTLSDPTLAQASIYFRHYLFEAMAAVDLGDRFADMLGPWRAMLAKGLTTWSETADPARSDCHAWGASPNVAFPRMVLGVDSDGPGFSRVAVRPQLGSLTAARGSIPHPKGEIAVDFSRSGEGLRAEVTLPPQTTGFLQWRGQRRPLHQGTNHCLF